ncbi:hypothetical protein niasHT_015192 [Heterodera trifolii]|uniref:RING-type domain-containing protein n=1 Tax=Heterodera trifolii TaxID=157864 RepID=A0ABD2L358_9BILA
MSDSSMDAIRELQRALREQQRTIFFLRSQMVDHRAVILQNVARTEALEGYAANSRWGRFRPRYSPMVSLEMTHLGRRLEEREQRRRAQAETVDAPAATESDEEGTSSSSVPSNVQSTSGLSTGMVPVNAELISTQATPLSSRVNNGVPLPSNVAQAGASSGNDAGAVAENSVRTFGATIENHMNRSQFRLVREELAHRSIQHQVEQQHQQLLHRAERDRQEHIRQQFDEAEVLQEQLQNQEEQQNDENVDPRLHQQRAAQQAQYERLVRLQLRESRRFRSGVASSVLVPPPLFWEGDCVICTNARANFYNIRCGHVCLCADCAVAAVIQKITVCILCRAPVNGIYPYVR